MEFLLKNSEGLGVRAPILYDGFGVVVVDGGFAEKIKGIEVDDADHGYGYLHTLHLGVLAHVVHVLELAEEGLFLFYFVDQN